MRAIHLNEFGDVEQFQIIEIPEPAIGADEVLLSVKSFSINPVETLIRGGYAFTQAFENTYPRILGWDVAGEVAKVGSNVENFEEGDEVFGMVRFPLPANGYAEYITAPANELAIKPDNVSYEAAAGATLAALTAYQGLTHKANIQANQKVLIQAAAGGVGHYAIQIAKYMGAYVIGTSSESKRSFVLSLGADEHVDYTKQRFEDRVQDADLVWDGVGGDNSYRSLKAIKNGGTVVTLVAMATDLPQKAEQEGKNGIIMMVQPSGNDMKAIADMMESGYLQTHVDKIYKPENIADAHKYVESRRTTGKVVVTF